MKPTRTLVSLKATPAYKPLPRRRVEVVQAPWMPRETATTTAAPTGSLPAPVQPPQNTQQQEQQEQLTVVSYDEIDNNDLDCDEFVDPFASDKNKGLVDNYDDDDEEDEDDDLDDEEAELRAALRQIQEEREREHRLLVKTELGTGAKNEEGVGGADKALFSNPLLIQKVTTSIKTQQSIKNEMINGIKSEIKAELNNDGLGGIGAGGPGAPVKRKKWTSDSIFSNTALSLGDDTDPNKRQRLNNDTINSDKHRDFMKGMFKWLYFPPLPTTSTPVPIPSPLP